jgi:hypothetical protein
VVGEQGTVSSPSAGLKLAELKHSVSVGASVRAGVHDGPHAHPRSERTAPGNLKGESWSHDEKLFPLSPPFPGSRRSGSRLPPLRKGNSGNTTRDLKKRWQTGVAGPEAGLAVDHDRSVVRVHAVGLSHQLIRVDNF